MSFLISFCLTKKASLLASDLINASCLFIRLFMIILPGFSILAAYCCLTARLVSSPGAPCRRIGYRVNRLRIFPFPCRWCMVLNFQHGSCPFPRKQCREPSLPEGSCLFLNKKYISSWALPLQPARCRCIPGNVLWGRVSRRDLFPFRCKTHTSLLLP